MAPLVLTLLVAVAAHAVAQLQTARIRGTVVDSTGQPVPGTAVVLTDPLGAVLQRSTTDSAGRFSFEDVAPGRFLLGTEPAAANRSAAIPLTIESALPVDVVLRLPPRLEEAVQVEGRIDLASTRASLAGESLPEVPVRVRGRSLQDAIATLPGWATEDNGLLHTRGVDDGFLYVIDGIPVYERLDALNGIAPDTATMSSISVVTGYVPPEFGYKAGGVIEVRSSAATDRWRATGDAGVGSFATAQGGLVAGGALTPQFGLHLAGSSWRSDRLLDPVHPDNLHNTGAQGATSGDIDYRGCARPRQVRLVGRPLALRRAEHRGTGGRGTGPASTRLERRRHRVVAACLVGSHRHPARRRTCGGVGARWRAATRTCPCLRHRIDRSPGPGSSRACRTSGAPTC